METLPGSSVISLFVEGAGKGLQVFQWCIRWQIAGGHENKSALVLHTSGKATLNLVDYFLLGSTVKQLVVHIAAEDKIPADNGTGFFKIHFIANGKYGPGRERNILPMHQIGGVIAAEMNDDAFDPGRLIIIEDLLNVWFCKGCKHCCWDELV